MKNLRHDHQPLKHLRHDRQHDPLYRLNISLQPMSTVRQAEMQKQWDEIFKNLSGSWWRTPILPGIPE